jgi:hypothetical protein
MVRLTPSIHSLLLDQIYSFEGGVRSKPRGFDETSKYTISGPASRKARKISNYIERNLESVE